MRFNGRMTSPAAPGRPVFAVLYTYSDDVTTRDEVRPRHRAYLAELLERGLLLASGPWAGAEGKDDGALLVVTADDIDTAAALLDEDPFRQVGVVAGREIREWVQVMGPWAPSA